MSQRKMADHKKIEGAVDSISNLPDVILQHILCYIPTKLAISTSLLSRRWRHVWCDIPSLSLYVNTLTAASANETLTRYTAPNMKSFHPILRIYPTSTCGSSAPCHTTLRICPSKSGINIMSTSFQISSTTVLLSSNSTSLLIQLFLSSAMCLGYPCRRYPWVV